MDELLCDVEEAVDPRTGRPYFYNRVTEESAWTLQEVIGDTVVIEDIKEVVDREKGRVYFVNSKTLKKAWRLTDLLRTREHTTLASHIVERHDPIAGRPYFLNTQSNRTAWNRSELIQVLDTSAAANAEVVVEVSTAELQTQAAAAFVTHEGWLDKKDKANRRWQKRYFRLADGNLRYYTDERAKSSRQCIKLDEQVSLNKQVDAKDPTEFLLITPKRIWKLKAKTNNEMMNWLQALKNNLQIIRPVADVSSLTPNPFRPRGKSLFSEKVEKEWALSDKKGTGKLKLKDIKHLMRRLNANETSDVVKERFKQFDADGNGFLNYAEFRNLLLTARSVPNTDELYNQAIVNSANEMAQDAMTDIQLLAWLQGPQQSGHSTLADAQALIRKFRTRVDSDSDPDSGQRAMTLDRDGFTDLLTDPVVNCVCEPERQRKVYQNMELPMSHYYISSSHNTYLSGNQLTSDCSTDAILHALRMGVRVIELDTWDGEHGTPEVYHGHTLTRRIAFAECVQVIALHGFERINTPIILTIENHCGLEQQTKMARILRNIFGELLYTQEDQSQSSSHSSSSSSTATVDGMSDNPMLRMVNNNTHDDNNSSSSPPSLVLTPSQLSGKVIIRDKLYSPPKKVARTSILSRLQSPRGGGKDGGSGGSDDEGDNDDEDAFVQEETVQGTVGTVGTVQGTVQGPHSSTTTVVGTQKTTVVGTQKNARAPEYLELITIRNIKLQDVLTHQLVSVHSYSVNETKLEKLVRDQPEQLVQQSRRHLARVYPAGFRVNSSNYSPQLAWSAGCQLVALNYQAHDRPVWLNQGKFMDNGGCGWVLKPSILLKTPSQSADSEGAVTGVCPWLQQQPKQKGKAGGDKSADASQVQQTMQIEVISGHYLPKPNASAKGEIIDPFVKVEISGAPADCCEFKTLTINNNGFNPSWCQTFEFPLTMPELATLLVTVKDEDNLSAADFVGQYALPVSCVRPGYRVIPLKNKMGHRHDWAYIFCHVQFKPPVHTPTAAAPATPDAEQIR